MIEQILFYQMSFESISKKIPKGVKNGFERGGGYD